VLREWGYDVRPQVGVAGYRIDLGLRHPAVPGAYALGIECDGAMYHSSRAARDRDRLREEVLTGLGWTLHRIWGTDWYRDRTAAEQRLRQAVERAVAADPREAWTDPVRVPPTPAAEPVPAEQRVPVDTAPDRPWSAPYEVSAPYVTPTYELHTPEARPALRKLLTTVIEAEGPIHEDLLVQRAREAWGVGRAGTRIRDNIRQVLRALAGSGLVVVQGDFLDTVNRSDLRARHPVADAIRKCPHIPATERQLVLRELTAESPGMSRDELIRQTCDYFGWKRRGPDISSALDADIAVLLAGGVLTETAGGITIRR
jgi:very-short-patch-repair endonuclease